MNATVIAPGTSVTVVRHGMAIHDAVITGTSSSERDGVDFVYTYRRTSNGASGIILPNLVHRHVDA